MSEVSIGDYVLAGGESAVLVMVEAVTRLLPGVVGNRESVEFDSHADGLLEGPSYTRPASWRGHEVPPVLLSGDHAAIDRWRRAESLRRTAEPPSRPAAALPPEALTDAERALLDRMAERAARPAGGAGLVLDPDGRVLLFGARLTDPATPPGDVLFWYTPGGRVEDGGSAARRRRPRAGRGDRSGRRAGGAGGAGLAAPARRAAARRAAWTHRETYFVLRDVVHEVDVSGPTEIEVLRGRAAPLVDGRGDRRERRDVRPRGAGRRARRSCSSGPWTGPPRIVA